MTPEQIHQLPNGEQVVLGSAFADAINQVFVDALPVVLAGFLLTWLLRETALRTTSAQLRRATLEN